MVRRHDREELLAAAVDVVAQTGLGALTFRRVAQRLGIPDRTVVYYFPTKEALLAAVLQTYADRLQELLAGALGDKRRPPREVLERAWAALQAPEAEPASRVFLEVVGLAAARQPPYQQLSATVAQGWLSWLAEHVSGPAGTHPQTAAALLAQLDGLLLLRHAGGPELADAAARGLAVDATTASNTGR